MNSDEVISGSIRACRLPGGNIELTATHAGDLVRQGVTVIERAYIDDAIAALQALRGDWRTAVGDAVEATNIALPRRLIERYVRAAVEVRGTKGRIDGTIEIGLHYDPGDKPHAFRDKMLEVGEVAVRVLAGRSLDEDTAASITEDLDGRLVGLWGDRPRFIEIWRGAGDDAEPLTQVYAPHGIPIRRPRASVLQELRAFVVKRPPTDAVAVALLGLIDELGGEP